MEYTTIISTLIGIATTIGSLIFFIGKMNQKVEQSNQKDTNQDELINTLFSKLDEKHEQNYKKIEKLQEFANKTAPAIEHYGRIGKETIERLNKLEQNSATLNQQISQAPTMREVRNEFVSKEMFRQLEKHLDEKFSTLQKGIGDILDKLGGK